MVIRHLALDHAIRAHIVGIQQVHQLVGGQLAQLLEVGGFKRLDEHRGFLTVQLIFGQQRHQRFFQAQAQLLVIGRVLGFRVDANLAAGFFGFLRAQGEDFVKSRNLKLPVKRLAAVGARLDGAQGFDFRQGKVAGEPAFFFHAIHHHLALAAGELGAAGHVGGVFQIGFVAGDQHTVLGHHQIRLDKVRAQLDGLGVAFQRVVGQITRSATVGDDQRRLAIEGGKHWLAGRQRGQGQRGGAGQQKGFVHCVRLFECYVRQGWRANSLAQQDEGFLTAYPALGRRTTRLARRTMRRVVSCS